MTDQNQLRDKDLAVLHQIQEGNDDIQKITSSLTLENHEVNYCFQKLADLELIKVEKPDGLVTRHINGQKRVFEAPKQATLTQKAQNLLNKHENSQPNHYQDLTREELIQKIHRLEQRLDMLEQKFRDYIK